MSTEKCKSKKSKDMERDKIIESKLSFKKKGKQLKVN